MQITAIGLDEQDKPDTVTASLTLAELLLVCRFAGRFTGPDGDELAPRGSQTAEAVHSKLRRRVFRRFWREDGMDGAERHVVRVNKLEPADPAGQAALDAVFSTPLPGRGGDSLGL